MAFLLRRQASRVVLLNTEKEVLLINAVDPAAPAKPGWWEIPGGGIDPGETSAACAQRELWEEAGQDNADIGPVVWTQHVQFTFGGYDFDQDEVIHIAWTTNNDIHAPQGLEHLEALAFQGARWWTLDEVEKSSEAFLPPLLPQLLGALVDGDLPDPPLDIAHV